MKLTVIGSSPAWPNPGEAHAGYTVEGEGTLLLDCGPGVLGKLREREAWQRIDAIAITHFHLDHFGDLVPWVWLQRHGPETQDVTPALHVPPGGRERLATIGEQLGEASMFEQTFELSEFAAGEEFEAAGFRLTAHRMPHYSETAFGFQVTASSSRLAYSGDTGPGDEVVELARDAGLFLCEATLESAEDGPRGHLSLAEAVSAFEASGAARLLLTHRPAELGTDGFEVARPGLVVQV